MQTQLTASAQQAIEENFKNTQEAFMLLDLINTEFQSDPNSIACFDTQIIERVKRCVARKKAFEATSVFGG
jgi:hypothetical protein